MRWTARKFASFASRRQASMLARCAGIMSLGHQVSCGARRAKSAMCCPVPLPSSSTSPDASRKKSSIADQMAAWLRRKAGPSSRPSGAGGWPMVPKSTTNLGMVAGGRGFGKKPLQLARSAGSGQRPIGMASAGRCRKSCSTLRTRFPMRRNRLGRALRARLPVHRTKTKLRRTARQGVTVSSVHMPAA